MNRNGSNLHTLLGVMIPVLLWGLFVTAPVYAQPSVIAVPVSLDYPLLRHALVTQLFNTADGSRDILDDPGGCNSIRLSDPDVGAQQDKLEVMARVTAQLGLSAFGGCQEDLIVAAIEGFPGHGAPVEGGVPVVVGVVRDLGR